MRHVIAGGSGLVLMPTGGGKSLCYQVPALCREGLAVVVSPLIALMDDQVLALRQAGVRAAALHSGLSSEAVSVLWRSLLRGELDLLYVSPERLLGGDLLERLQERPLALFAIDEAHCVSQWGHDFRPEYLQLEALAQRFPQVPRLALTATADPRTRGEIIERLALEQGRVFLASFDRPNIRYLLRPKQEAKEQLLAFLEEFRGEAGIVYARSRSRVDSFAALLQAAGHDAVGVSRRHGRRASAPAPSAASATTAAWWWWPRSPSAWASTNRMCASSPIWICPRAWRPTTRKPAGRDATAFRPPPGWCTGRGMCPSCGASSKTPSAEAAQKRIEHGKLDALVGFTEAPGCRRQVLLAHLGETLAEPCGNCDRCLEPQVLEDRTVAAQKALSAVYRTGQRFGAAHLTDVLLGADTARVRSLGHHEPECVRHRQGAEPRAVAHPAASAHQPGLAGAGARGPRRVCAGGRRRGSGALLRGDLNLELPAAPPRQERRRAAARAAAAEPEADASLMTALKDWRRAQAREQGVPPYVVFHDRTLVELAARRPARLADLGQVSGIGAAKLDRYGEAVLAVIEGWQAQT